jgi:hypothetical protein
MGVSDVLMYACDSMSSSFAEYSAVLFILADFLLSEAAVASFASWYSIYHQPSGKVNVKQTRAGYDSLE